MYLSSTTKPGISYARSYLARFLQQPLKHHWTEAKHVLRYLRSRKNFGICYDENGNNVFECYADSDWAQERSDRKPVTGFVFVLAAGAVSCKSNKQSFVAQSSV